MTAALALLRRLNGGGADGFVCPGRLKACPTMAGFALFQAVKGLVCFID
jgi:hypothetical protein